MINKIVVLVDKLDKGLLIVQYYVQKYKEDSFWTKSDKYNYSYTDI